MILVNVFLIIAGALIDDVSVTVVIAPLLLPLMASVDIHPVHMAPVLFMACRIGRASVHQAVGPAVRMMAFVALPVMLLTSFVPAVSLALPRWLEFL